MPIRRELAFAREEYETRLEKLWSAMENRGLDAVLCFDPRTHNYLSGYQTMELTHYRCLVVPLRGELAMVTSDFERPGVELTSITDDITDYHYLGGDYLHATLNVLKRVCPGAERVGLEKSNKILTASRSNALLRGLRGLVVDDFSDVLQRLRWVKSSAEVECIARAARISSKGMRAAMDSVADGVSDNEIAAKAYGVMTEEGSEYMCYAPFVTTGRRSGVPHTTYTGEKVRKGDVVFIELGACVERYSGPLMRSAHVGRVSPNARKNAETLLDVLNTMIDELRPGLSCGEVARSVRRKGHKAVGSRIVSPSLLNGDYGYSIGLGFPPTWGEEGLLLSLENKEVLEPGMVFHLNETLREVHQYGLSFSETVVVTKKGCRVLTDFERSFLSR
jgi:Xaa-Pro dipeptidase